MKMGPVGTELFYADRQTDRQRDRQTGRQADRQTYRQTDGQTDGQTEITKLIVDCRNFANDPLNYGEPGEPG